jgi:UDP-glucose 4-epimerase
VRILVTGSAGHLGEALVRTLADDGHDAVGLDLLPSPHTDVVASITVRPAVRAAVAGAAAVLHAATLHKPHVSSHSRQEIVGTNVSGR